MLKQGTGGGISFEKVSYKCNWNLWCLDSSSISNIISQKKYLFSRISTWISPYL